MNTNNLNIDTTSEKPEAYNKAAEAWHCDTMKDFSNQEPTIEGGRRAE